MLANDSLTPKQQTFITAYLTPGLTIEAAAKVAGIAEKTAYRYLKLPSVQEGIKQARADIYQQAIFGLVHLVEKSVDTLERNLDAPDAPGVQVRAAQIILERTTEIFKLSELEKDLAEVKRLLAQQEDV